MWRFHRRGVDDWTVPRRGAQHVEQEGLAALRRGATRPAGADLPDQSGPGDPRRRRRRPLEARGVLPRSSPEQVARYDNADTAGARRASSETRPPLTSGGCELADQLTVSGGDGPRIRPGGAARAALRRPSSPETSATPRARTSRKAERQAQHRPTPRATAPAARRSKDPAAGEGWAQGRPQDWTVAEHLSPRTACRRHTPEEHDVTVAKTRPR